MYTYIYIYITVNFPNYLGVRSHKPRFDVMNNITIQA